MNNDDLKKSWPRGSLQRVLAKDFPGCSSALEAFKKAVNQKPEQTALQSTEIEQSLKLAMDEIAEATKDFDLDKISLPKKELLATMPLTTISEIILWKDKWLKFLEEAKW